MTVHIISTGIKKFKSQCIGLYRHLTVWKEMCMELGWHVGNCITSDTLILDSQQSQHLHLIVDILLTKFGLHQQLIQGQKELEQVLLETYKLSEKYAKALMELHTKEGMAKALESQLLIK